jgi:hypothetical protein
MVVYIVTTLHYRSYTEFFYLYGGVKHPPNERTGKEQNKIVGKTI